MIEFLRKLFYPITAPINFIQNHFKAMVFLLILILLFGDTNSEDLQQHNVEKISLVGPIFDVSEVIEQLDDAATNSNVKGVLFEVNSPGGAVAPSVELAYAVKRLQEVKPVVVYSGGMLASGGYYASVWADKIVANPGAMVGSIGVIMHGANLEEIMQKIGIKSQIIQAGAFKQVGTSDREWTKEERGELDKVIQDTYNMFVANVADGRDLNISNAKDFANAHIFTASQAKEVGLVDELGVEYDAKNLLVELSGVDVPIWNKADKIDEFMKKLTSQGASMLHVYFPSLTMK
jgi:protease-4